MWGWIGIFAALTGILTSIRALYVQLIKPHMVKTKLHQVLAMITVWFDNIDCNLERGVNMAELNNQENKIHEFIRVNLKGYKITPTPKIIRAWLKRMGVKTELRNSSDLFEKSSRVPVEGIALDIYFVQMIAAFMGFHADYVQKRTGNRQFVDLEMQLKFLRFYVKEPGYGR